MHAALAVPAMPEGIPSWVGSEVPAMPEGIASRVD